MPTHLNDCDAIEVIEFGIGNSFRFQHHLNVYAIILPIFDWLISTLWSEEHPWNAYEPMDVTSCGMETDIREAQLLNVPACIEVMADGSVIDWSEEHPWNAYEPMDDIACPTSLTSTLDSDVHPSNAKSGRLVVLSPRYAPVNDRQS